MNIAYEIGEGGISPYLSWIEKLWERGESQWTAIEGHGRSRRRLCQGTSSEC